MLISSGIYHMHVCLCNMSLALKHLTPCSCRVGQSASLDIRYANGVADASAGWLSNESVATIIALAAAKMKCKCRTHDLERPLTQTMLLPAVVAITWHEQM